MGAAEARAQETATRKRGRIMAVISVDGGLLIYKPPIMFFVYVGAFNVNVNHSAAKWSKVAVASGIPSVEQGGSSDSRVAD